MFSIIIPLFNKQSTIAETIQSALSQLDRQFELVIVNDGSTDISLEIAMRFTDSRIKILNKENGGVSSARNLGIQHAKYSYIAFLDADDFWEPDYLQEQKKLIEEFPDAGLYGCAWNYKVNVIEKVVNHNLPKNFRDYINNYFGMKKTSNIFWTSSVVVNKKVFKKVGSFDERIAFGEDLDMWYRIILNYNVVFYNKTLAYYKIDAENRAMDNQIPLNKFLPFYIEKYSDFRKSNKEFRKFFDRFCLGAIFPYYSKKEYKADVNRIVKQIDFSLQPFRWKLQFMFPHLFNLLFKTRKWF